MNGLDVADWLPNPPDLGADVLLKGLQEPNTGCCVEPEPMGRGFPALPEMPADGNLDTGVKSSRDAGFKNSKAGNSGAPAAHKTPLESVLTEAPDAPAVGALVEPPERPPGDRGGDFDPNRPPDEVSGAAANILPLAPGAS